MKSREARSCDICGESIPRGTFFRSGWTTPAALSGGDPATRPSFDLEADGTARVDLCGRCSDSEQLLALTTEDVDVLH